MMWLPGENAKKFRSKAAEILTSYYAGDVSLLKEIEANAASDAPINQMARASLQNKKKGEELEQESLKKMKLENVALSLSNVTTFCNLMGQLRPNWRSDERLLLQTEDWLKNATFGTANAITNGNSVASISISQVASELGMRPLTHGESCQVGKMAAEAYRQRHGRNPPTHKQFVDGQVRDVKSYTEADRNLIEDVLITFRNM